MRRTVRMLLAAGALLGFATPVALLAQVRAVIVAGLGGDPKYTAEFTRNAERLAAALHDRFGAADSDIHWFGEDSTHRGARFRGLSTKENVERTLGALAASGNASTTTVIVLIGHGAGDAAESRVSLPGPDITAADFQKLLARFGTQRLAFVDLTSASGDMLGLLSAPGRVVITATKSSFERNESHFGDFFVDALSAAGADLDKDGRVSLLEAFQYAAKETKRLYENDSRIQTEHPQLDDDGDHEGTGEPTSKTADGLLARRFFLDQGPQAVAATGDARVTALYRERFALEDAVEELKRRKGTTAPDAYAVELERALVALARKAREIRLVEGGR
jgi:hypothetical protein